MVISNMKLERNIIFCWKPWIWKTYQAENILAKYKSENTEWTIHDDFLTYSVSDGKFKQMVKSNMLYLRTPKEWESSYKSYPLEMMIRCKVLLYDDIWVSDMSDAYIRDLTFILDERIKKGLINIITTNLNQEELEEKLNKRIVSRLILNTDIVPMEWEDRRQETSRVVKLENLKIT